LSSTTSIFPTLEAIVKSTLQANTKVKLRSLIHNKHNHSRLQEFYLRQTVKNPYTAVKNLYKVIIFPVRLAECAALWRLFLCHNSLAKRPGHEKKPAEMADFHLFSRLR
jgi:hypothetical protein